MFSASYPQDEVEYIQPQVKQRQTEEETNPQYETACLGPQKS